MHFLTDRHNLYAKTRVSGQGCAFWGSQQHPTTFRGSNPQKTSGKWPGIGISQPNQRSSKIAIYQSLMKILAPNFPDRLITGNITRGVQKVLQLVYKKDPQTFKHSGIFQYSLPQHQCSFPTFLPSCLFLKKEFSVLFFKPCFNNSYKQFDLSSTNRFLNR